MFTREIAKWDCLTAPMPLRPGERACAYCAGYGYLPVNKRDPHMTRFYPERCSACEGRGKA